MHHDQMGFILKFKDGSRHTENIIHHQQNEKVKNHIPISVDAQEAFDKIQHLFMIKKVSTNCI